MPLTLKITTADNPDRPILLPIDAATWRVNDSRGRETYVRALLAGAVAQIVELLEKA